MIHLYKQKSIKLSILIITAWLMFLFFFIFYQTIGIWIYTPIMLVIILPLSLYILIKNKIDWPIIGAIPGSLILIFSFFIK